MNHNDDNDAALLEFVSILCNPPHHRSLKDLNNLAIPDRQRVFQDLAGSSTVENEDLLVLVQSIHEMKERLVSIKDKVAFELAKQQNPDYTLDPAFLLMFLRATEYNPKNAAEMLVAHFEEKLILFGQEQLTRNIKLSDLSEDDMESLGCGGVQIANTKDQAGRAIAYFRKAEYKWKSRENWLRAFWYLWMATLQDEDIQRRGIVAVAFELGDTQPKHDYELIRREMHMLKCIPMRIVASHFCTGTQSLLNVLDLVLHMATPFFRVRARAHCGIETEILYQLMTFGIPPSSIPWIAGGSKYHDRWIEERRLLESGNCLYMDEDFEEEQDDDNLDDDISYSHKLN